MPFARLNLTYQDYAKESAQVSFRGTELTAANFDAQNALMTSLVSAVEAVVIGNLNKDIRIASEDAPSPGPPSDKDAHRENKWLVRMFDDASGAAVSVSLPCADSQFLAPNSDEMDQSTQAYADLVDAIESYHLAISGQSVTVIGVTMVGRNL